MNVEREYLASSKRSKRENTADKRERKKKDKKRVDQIKKKDEPGHPAGLGQTHPPEEVKQSARKDKPKRKRDKRRDGPDSNRMNAGSHEEVVRDDA